jgi:hypothetical protein
MIILRVAILTFFATALTHAQSSAEAFAQRYPAVTFYEVRPGVFMTPTRGPQGQVCKMTVEKRRLNGNELDSDALLSDELIKALVDELAPEKQRGKELTDFKDWFDSILVGTLSISRTNYEHASVEVWGAVLQSGEIQNSTLVIIWKRDGCPPSKISKTPR